MLIENCLKFDHLPKPHSPEETVVETEGKRQHDYDEHNGQKQSDEDKNHADLGSTLGGETGSPSSSFDYGKFIEVFDEMV